MADSDGKIIRAGFRSNSFMAGTATVDISGLFSKEDAEDVVSLLKLTIRSVERQATKENDENSKEV
jgi:hypothetical protein